MEDMFFFFYHFLSPTNNHIAALLRKPQTKVGSSSVTDLTLYRPDRKELDSLHLIQINQGYVGL